MFDLNLIGVLFSVVSLFLAFYTIFFVPLKWISKLEDLVVGSKITRISSMRTKGQKVPPPFPNGWFAIAESSEIVAGAAKSINCLGENFVVFRSKRTREVFVLDAYCPHLGANLGVGGIVKDDCIECPFHQWKFSGKDGSCVEIPYSDSLTVEKSANLRKWKSKEADGLVFIWFHAEQHEPWDLPTIDEISNGKWKFHGKNEFIVNGHLQDVAENIADVAHFKSVHSPSILAGSDIRFSRSKLLSIGSHFWDATWRVDEDDRYTTSMSITHHMRIWKIVIMKLEATLKQYGPGHGIVYLNSSFGRMAIIKISTPVGPLMQKLTSYIYGPRHLAWFVKMTLIAESITIARDVMIWNHMKFLSSPLLPKEDKTIKKFRVWFSQFYSENSKSFESSKQDLSW